MGHRRRMSPRSSALLRGIAALQPPRALFHCEIPGNAGLINFADLFVRAGEYFIQRSGNPFGEFLAKGVSDIAQYDMLFTGGIADHALHDMRHEFDRLLVDFVSGQEWWRDPNVRLIFELICLRVPYIYSEPVITPDSDFKACFELTADGQGYRVALSGRVSLIISELAEIRNCRVARKCDSLGYRIATAASCRARRIAALYRTRITAMR